MNVSYYDVYTIPAGSQVTIPLTYNGKQAGVLIAKRMDDSVPTQVNVKYHTSPSSSDICLALVTGGASVGDHRIPLIAEKYHYDDQHASIDVYWDVGSRVIVPAQVKKAQAKPVASDKPALEVKKAKPIEPKVSAAPTAKVEGEAKLLFAPKNATHKVTLKEQWLTHIRSGTKTVEGRMYSGPFMSYRVGDRVEYEGSIQGSKVAVPTRVVALRRHPTIEEYLQKEGLERCLPGVASLEDGVAVYQRIYTDKDHLSKHGMLAIEFELLEAAVPLPDKASAPQHASTTTKSKITPEAVDDGGVSSHVRRLMDRPDLTLTADVTKPMPGYTLREKVTCDHKDLRGARIDSVVDVTGKEKWLLYTANLTTGKVVLRLLSPNPSKFIMKPSEALLPVDSAFDVLGLLGQANVAIPVVTESSVDVSLFSLD